MCRGKKKEEKKKKKKRSRTTYTLSGVNHPKPPFRFFFFLLHSSSSHHHLISYTLLVTHRPTLSSSWFSSLFLPPPCPSFPTLITATFCLCFTSLLLPFSLSLSGSLSLHRPLFAMHSFFAIGGLACFFQPHSCNTLLDNKLCLNHNILPSKISRVSAYVISY